MSTKKWLLTGVVACGAILAAIAGINDAPQSQASDEVPIIRIDGSSTVYPVTEAMAEEFQIDHRGEVRVTVGVSGTGGGFQRFCRGETVINDASRPIAEDERALCAKNGIEFIELPIALDAITVAVNPKNDWAKNMTVEELRKIWRPEAQGEIKKWSQVNPEWPDKPINLYGPGPASGTYDYFTEVIVGESGASRGDYTASEDDNVLVRGVAQDPYALGYFGLAYYEENQDKLDAVAIDDGSGEPVLPSVETAKSGEYKPLSRPLFIYVAADAADRKWVQEFIHYYLDPERASVLVPQVGYVPLPEAAYKMALKEFEQRDTGSAFATGKDIGDVKQMLTVDKP